MIISFIITTVICIILFGIFTIFGGNISMNAGINMLCIIYPCTIYWCIGLNLKKYFSKMSKVKVRIIILISTISIIVLLIGILDFALIFILLPLTGINIFIGIWYKVHKTLGSVSE